MKVLNKKDILLISFVLIVSLTLFFIHKYQYTISTPSNEVEIYINGNLYKTLKIEEGKEVDIENTNNKNTIKFTKNGVFMLNSSCKNKLCIHQGEVNINNYKNRLLGNNIICLPNRVSIVLKLKNTQSKDVIDAY